MESRRSPSQDPSSSEGAEGSQEDVERDALGLPLDFSLNNSDSLLSGDVSLGKALEPRNVHRVEDDSIPSLANGGVTQSQENLERRVQELETKLAVLSRLLQTQRHVSSTTTPSRIHTPPRRLSPPVAPDPESYTSPSSIQIGTSIPHLESPAPLRKSASLDEDDDVRASTPLCPPLADNNEASPQKRSREKITEIAREAEETPGNGSIGKKRNLSFSLLYENNEREYERRRRTAPASQLSLTPSERGWLGPLILQFQKEQKVAEEAKEHNEDATNSNVPSASTRTKWLNYLNSFQDSTPDVDVQMEEFVKVPAQMEGLMMYGFLICMDSFLYMIVILPIRFVWSFFLLLLRIFLWRKPALHLQFHRRHSYQLIQVTICGLIYRYVLAGISIGKFYHWIRGQAMIKLYVIIAMVEVFDRLFCGLGQDCLESMYWNMVARPRSSRMVTSIILVLGYATCHTLILFVHVETLNVAMNSADQALLTLLISGNFAEIKSTVFKKYNRPALFKIAASDICERFKLGLFLGLVLLLNICQGMERGQLTAYLRTCSIVWCAELVADSIKHSFITKFNFLPSKVYREYALLLAGDVTGIGHEGVNLDHSHAVVKRIGFAQLPLVCVMFRLVREAFKYAQLNGLRNLSDPVIYSIGLGLWLILVAIKMGLGSLLQRQSLTKLRNAPEISATPKKNKVKTK